jgi:hypothetical protein
MCAPCSIGSGTAIAIKTGDHHVCILRVDSIATAVDSGEVLCWGDGGSGQLVSSIVTYARVILKSLKTLLEYIHVESIMCCHSFIVVAAHCNCSHCGIISNNRAMAMRITLVIRLLRYVLHLQNASVCYPLITSCTTCNSKLL